VATLRGPAGARLVAELNDEPVQRVGLDGSEQSLELRCPPGRIRRGLNVWTLRLEGSAPGTAVELSALEWPGP
jgi:hypothetical protein